MKKKDFETWFYRVVDRDLFNSLEPWQQARVKKLCLKAILKGKKLLVNE